MIEETTATIASTLEAGELRLIAPAELHESPLNPRKYFSEGPLAELARSIAASGVRVPLVARPRLEGPGYEIAAGHRRYRAAKLAGVATVPVIVRDMSDQDFLEVLTFDNHQREDVNALEEAAGFRTYINEAVADVATVAAKIGKSPSYVYGRLKLLDACAEAQKAFWDGRITAAHLELIARAPEHRDQKLALRACEPPSWNAEAGTLSVRDLKEWIGKNLQLDLSQAPFSRLDLDLVPEAGACGPCEHRLGNAPDFNALEDLAEMCTRGDCYQRKLAAHIEREKTRLGEGALLVSYFTSPSAGLLFANRDFMAVRSTDPGAREALIVEGPGAGRIIHVRLIEKAKAAPKPAPAAEEKAAPKQKLSKEQKDRIAERTRQAAEERRAESERLESERKEREAKLEAEKALRLKVLDAVLAKVKWPPKPEDLAGVLDQAAIDDTPEALDDVIASQGVEPMSMRYVAYGKLPADRLARLAVLIGVCDDFDEHAMGHGCEKLDALAKRYGVDARKLRAEAEGGTRKEVIGKLPALAGPKKAAAAKKAAQPKTMSAAQRKRIADAQKKRWQQHKAQQAKKGK